MSLTSTSPGLAPRAVHTMEPPPPPLKSPVKPPLITPSASPPPLRTELRYSRALSESAPPAKRQRTTSTPRPTIRGTPGPSLAQDTVDIDQQRRASTMRLLEFWESLASHTRALDDDDIVDVMTGKITRDNGVLRRSDKFTFGSLHAPSADYATSDEGSDTEEREHDRDELDAFGDEEADAEDLDEADVLELDARGKVIPPVTPLDPADAADLREFMEAERKRRELCGTDGEDEEYERDDEDYADEGTADESHTDTNDALPPESETTLGEEEEDEKEEEVVDGSDEEPGAYHQYSDYVVPLNHDSDDELDNWDVDDTNVVYPIGTADAEDQLSEEVKAVEQVPAPKPSKNSDKQVGSVQNTKSHAISPSKHASKPPQQLYTPPQSSSSSGPSATPMDPNFIDLTAEATPSPPSSLFSSPLVRSPTKYSSSQVKRSQNSVAKSNNSATRVQGTPTRGLGAPKPNESPSKGTPKRAVSKFNSAGQTPKLKAFVLLTPRKSSSPQKFPTSQLDDTLDDVSQSSPTKSSKGKGKMKQGSVMPQPPKLASGSSVTKKVAKTSPKKPQPAAQQHSLQDIDLHRTSSSPSKASRARTPRRKDETHNAGLSPTTCNSRSTPDNLHLLSPTFPSPPVRKRKRRLSESEMDPSESQRDTAEIEAVVDTLRRSTIAQHVSSSRSPNDGHKRDVSKPKKRSSSQRRRRTPESDSGSESSTSNGSGDHLSHSRAHSHAPSQYHYSHPSTSYSHMHPPPPGYAPMPDPRAQFIITQAMQQLSALVGAPWVPPHQYHENNAPHTPSHHHHSSRPQKKNPMFMTPTHQRHPYPYSYDPNLSHATLPPSSPDELFPEKQPVRRKSLVRRSRSRGRRVSFHVDDNGSYSAGVVHSSPSERRSRAEDREDWPQREDRPRSSSKGKGRARTPDMSSDEDSDVVHSDSPNHRLGRSIYSRGQTPGPNFDSSRKRENVQSSPSGKPGKSGRPLSRHDYRGG